MKGERMRRLDLHINKNSPSPNVFFFSLCLMRYFLSVPFCAKAACNQLIPEFLRKCNSESTLPHTGKCNAERNWYRNQGESFQHLSAQGRIVNYSQKADYHAYRIAARLLLILYKHISFMSEKLMSSCVSGIFQRRVERKETKHLWGFRCLV